MTQTFFLNILYTNLYVTNIPKDVQSTKWKTLKDQQQDLKMCWARNVLGPKLTVAHNNIALTQIHCDWTYMVNMAERLL